jgi:NAD(P)-dependent dehydrogenase (short-subunit alcohol dehydrogenase family)
MADFYILGGTGGLGKVISEELRKCNAKVIQIGSAAVDLTKEDDISSFVNRLPDSPITIVYAAGKSDIRFLKSETANYWGVNFDGLRTLLRLLALKKRQTPCKLIYLSSVLADINVPGTLDYSISKAASEKLIKLAALEAARTNVFTSAIRLGYFNAGMIKEVPDKMLENIIDQHPLKMLGDPKEIVTVILSLSTAKYLNGSIIDMNGGAF